ncbi:P-loop containing nucleoside triphosphate hydrolase protein [Xylariomycetidae sp. FL2044]|nr:P-loop containing nucleoside triphosphate hydrolase protein [Xylariomycetidae sp. FL2044]
MPSLSSSRWLLLSDIHFRHADLDRITRTAEWILSVPRRYPTISRVVICGDVLTSRTMQPTAVLSAAYRFLSELSSAVPHVNILLGNHDLAYRRDYATTALDALTMRRLSPFVSLHSDVASHEWDGRRVLILPFREEQGLLTSAVARLDPAEAAETVAFGHLALNRAVTQRHIVRSESGVAGFPATYRGFTGPDHFAALARTFTGHFHSHQTIGQRSPATHPSGVVDRLRGSVTYLGSPLQLSWADLYDENRGVVLLDPATLEHELIINPHAIGYITVHLSQIQNDKISPEEVMGKYVMVLGELSRFTYLSARDKLLSLGARGVREWRSSASLLSSSESNLPAVYSLGAYSPASDREAMLDTTNTSGEHLTLPQAHPDVVENLSEPSAAMQSVEVDPAQYVREYIQSLELDENLDKQREVLVRVGERLIAASQAVAVSGQADADYNSLLDSESTMNIQGDEAASTRQVFVAQPRTLTIANFLGVQEELVFDFREDIRRGLTFLVGQNGSGKSTLIEAMVWCQFGRCIRSGLTAADVVNDVAGKDCMVQLSFANGYSITRYRKHKLHGNRVIVTLNGVQQLHLEQPDARSTQAALNELLGIDYETYIKTVVLGHESAASFLSSTPAQRQELIESTLGLSSLDEAANLSRQMIREIDGDLSTLQSESHGILQTIAHIEESISAKEKWVKELRMEDQEAASTHEVETNKPAEAPEERHGGYSDQSRKAEILSRELEVIQQEIKDARRVMEDASLRANIHDRLSDTTKNVRLAEERLSALHDALSELALPVNSDPRARDQVQDIQESIRALNDVIKLFEEYVANTIQRLDKTHSDIQGLSHTVRHSLLALKDVVSQLERVGDQLTTREVHDADQRQARTETLQREQNEAEDHLREMIDAKEAVFGDLVHEMDMEEQVIRKIASDITDEDVQGHLSGSMNRIRALLDTQYELQTQLNAHQSEQTSQLQAAEEARAQAGQTEIALMRRQGEIATYTDLIRKERASITQKRQDHTAIEARITQLTSSHALFAFWANALAKSRARAKTVSSTTTTTFRAYVLDESLDELNVLASDVLATLFEDTRHSQRLTAGMLKTVFTTDDDDDKNNTTTTTSTSKNKPTAVLTQTLGVTTGLGYAKRSGGERKRVDLAVFFALVQVAQARSPHRARYLLVDEVFDSLDASGRAAVARWCARDLAARTDFQLVVTHSLAAAAGGGGGMTGGDDDEETEGGVIEAVMTENGTRFLVKGLRGE